MHTLPHPAEAAGFAGLALQHQAAREAQYARTLACSKALFLRAIKTGELIHSPSLYMRDGMRPWRYFLGAIGSEATLNLYAEAAEHAAHGRYDTCAATTIRANESLATDYGAFVADVEGERS